MGRPKALLPWNGVTLVEAWVALLSPLAEVVVIDGCTSLGHLVPTRTNAHWERTGPWESLRLGLEDHTGPALVTPVDVPPCSPASLRRLLAEPGDAVLGFEGRPGHPIRLADASRVRGPCPVGGLGSLLVRAAVVDCSDPRVVANMNRPADVGRWLG